MADEVIETAKAVFLAFARKDRQAIEQLLADDFRFTSPYDNRIDRAAYFERCWPNSENASEFRFVETARAGDKVFVSYEATWAGGIGGRNTEILTVRDGKVHEVEVFFGWNTPHPAARGESVQP
jgi:ketosteroid isomerase-like protein